MPTVFTPRTPEEFIDYYEAELKKELDVYNIQINKVGFLGFLLNILGHTNYDLKNYYDYLFKESFIATSETSENIHLHASIYGYFPSFAIAAEIIAKLEVDFNILPSKQNNVTRRELYINNPGQLLKFESEGYEFCTKASYKIIEENGQYKTIIITEDGESIQYPSPSSVLTPPLLDAKQYKEQEFNFRSSSYPANSFYSYPLEIEDGYIENIRVFVKEKNAIEEEEYEVKFVKYLETGSSKVVFLRAITQTKYVLELGSGLRGKWLPQADIRILVNVTKGNAGNFLKLSQSSQKEPQQVILIDLDSSGNIVSSTNLDSSQIVLINVESSEGGEDPLNDIELREETIRFIQTRDNLVSEQDFYNVAQKYMPDFKFLFKKIQVFDNVFHLCRVLRDRYQSVIQSGIHYVLESNFTDLYHPTFTIDGKDFISPFLYKFNSILNWYDAYLLYDNLLVYINSINLTDDVPPTYNVPPLYLNFIYDNVNKQTKIQLKSYQNISSLSFKLTIDLLSISEQNLTQIDVNTFEYVYSDNDGVIEGEMEVQIDAYDMSVKVFIAIVDSVYQTYDISDVLNLTKYEYQSNDYVVGIPVIDKDSYDSDPIYYLNKVNDFILGTRFSENRMISDNIQFRFLNSYIVKSPFLEESTLQGINIFDKVETWIQSVLSFENDPPSSVTNGERYIVDDNPTGDFIGHIDEIAEWNELPEITHVQCKAASTLSGGEWFQLNTTTDSYYVWYNIDISSADPAPAGLTGIVVNITSSDDAEEVADQTASALNVHPDFEATNINDLVVVINYTPGDVTDASDNNTGFTITTDQQGVDGHWIFSSPNEHDGVLVLSEPARYYYESNFWVQIQLKLPLKLKVTITVDQDYLTENNINLYNEKQNLLFQLADLLQKNYSTTNITYYNSQIIDFVHNNRNYIKSVEVEVRDSEDKLIPNGIESKDDREILEGLKINKFNIVRYTPTFWYWDVDNIELITLISE